MSCAPFTLAFTQEPEALVEKAQKALEKFDGTLDGDAQSGSLKVKTPVGSVRGTYSIENQNITITIAEKPMFVPCNMIEDQLKKALQD